MKRALLIIDMQKGSFTDDAHRHDLEGLTTRLNGLANRVREAGGVVIFVQHDGPEGDPHYPGSPGWELLPDLDFRADDIVVRKTVCDAFLNTALEEALEAQDVEGLIVTGCATDYCVDTTVRSALARSLPTIVPVDGHTTSNRSHMTAEKIIEHHNAIWADFIAPAGPAVLCPCEDVPAS